MQWFSFLIFVLTLGWEPITSTYLECHDCDGGGRCNLPLSVELQDTLLHAAGSMQRLGHSKRQTDPCPRALFHFSEESYSDQSPCRAFRKEMRRLSLPSPSHILASQESAMIQPNIYGIFIFLTSGNYLSQSNPIAFHKSIHRVRVIPQKRRLLWYSCQLTRKYQENVNFTACSI